MHWLPLSKDDHVDGYMLTDINIHVTLYSQSFFSNIINAFAQIDTIL